MFTLTEIASSLIGSLSQSYGHFSGGNSPSGFDCSEFVSHCLQQAGHVLPLSPTTGRPIRHTEEFFDFYGVLIHDDFRKEGDLVFFSKNFLRPTHLGIYLGENLMIHSPGIDNTVVEIDSIYSILPKSASSLNVKPNQIYCKNPIGFKRPAAIMNGQRFQKF